MSKSKKVQQLPIFTAGEELPLFTGSAYGSGVVPFVAREEGKQAAMFRPSFQELAEAKQKEKRHQAFMLSNGFTESDRQTNNAIYAIFYASGAWRVERMEHYLADWVKERDPYPVMCLRAGPKKDMVAVKYQLFSIMRRLGIEPV